MQTIDRTFQKRFASGHYGFHHNVVIQHEGKPIELKNGAGSSDHVHVMDAGSGIYYVLSVNYRLGYCGMSVYDVRCERTTEYDVNEREDHEVLTEAHSVFFQDWHTEDALGKNWADLGTHELATLLSEWCY